jgi:hypothetical protein
VADVLGRCNNPTELHGFCTKVKLGKWLRLGIQWWAFIDVSHKNRKYLNYLNISEHLL